MKNMMKKSFTRIAGLTLAVAVAGVGAGCSSSGSPSAGSTGSEAKDGYVASATIRRVGESSQYQTNVTIERAELDGSLTLMSSPAVLSLAGQPATITIESTCSAEDLRVEVDIPAPGSGTSEATITVSIYDGEIVAAEPVIVLAMPE